MKAIVYQYTEAPLIIEEVTGLIPREDDLTIVSRTDGKLDLSMDDVLKVELIKDDQ